MSAHEVQVWDRLNKHWERGNNRRGLPNWAKTAVDRTGEVEGNAMSGMAGALPEAVKEPVRRAGDEVANRAVKPAIEAATAMVELVNDWALELNDPKCREVRL